MYFICKDICCLATYYFTGINGYYYIGLLDLIFLSIDIRNNVFLGSMLLICTNWSLLTLNTCLTRCTTFSSFAIALFPQSSKDLVTSHAKILNYA